MNRWGAWPEYVSAAERQRSAKQAIAKLTKQGAAPAPVVITGRAIATTFWGKGWCEHLERFSDYENRLPRGRSYVRSGAVVDLRIGPGRVDARVRGTSLYKVSIVIKPLGQAAWREIVRACAGKVDSLVALLQGRFDAAVMQIVGRAAGGLFPEPAQITMTCSCPDWATMCKHLAAVLYGVGARLDARPELLFTLREVDPADLVASAPSTLSASAKGSTSKRLDADSLADVFGIELDAAGPPALAKAAPGAKTTPAAKAALATKTAVAAKAAPATKTAVAAKATPATKAAFAGKRAPATTAQRGRDAAQPARTKAEPGRAPTTSTAKAKPAERRAPTPPGKASASGKVVKAPPRPKSKPARGQSKT